MTPRSVTVIPAVRYADADKAIEWLKNTLGFVEHAIHRNSAGVIEHAELTLGNGMLMLGTDGLNPEMNAYFTLPVAVGNRVTCVQYVIVEDAAQTFARAEAAGAEVLSPLRTMGYGGGAFTLRDPEGQVWSIGEYDPWGTSA